MRERECQGDTRVYESWRWRMGRSGMRVLRGSAGTGKVGDAAALVTPSREVHLRELGLGDVAR